jgi:hypothetical protein
LIFGKIDIGQILNQVNDEGGVIAVIETENTKPYTFVIYKTLLPAWVDKYPSQAFPNIPRPYTQTMVTNGEWTRWVSSIDPVQLLKEYRAKNTVVRTKVTGYK